MALLDSVGALVGGILASLVMLVFAVLSFFITVFIVDAGANLAGLTPGADAIVVSAALLSAGAVAAGASPMTGLVNTP